MANVVLQVDKNGIQKLNGYYKDYLLNNNPPGSVFTAQNSNCKITAYHSGKVLFQGKNAETEANKWKNLGTESTPKKNTTKAHSFLPPDNIGALSIVGTDEVGTGDYFGPIVVCAAFVEKNQLGELKRLGVRDSKNLTDTQIINIAKQLKTKITFSLLVLHNEKYNDLVDKGMTQTTMKAMLHNQALNLIWDKIHDTKTIDGILIDQFTTPASYFNCIKNKEKRWREPIYLATKAESIHLSVAAASILARYYFVNEFDKLAIKAGIDLQKGAGAKVDEIAAKIIKRDGQGKLREIAKVHFANTKKALLLTKE